MTEKKVLAYAGLLTLMLATLPLFFDIYRTAAFNTVPHDDYAPYLLTLVGQSGSIPGAPYAYRIISVAAAIPFYYILPLYTFSNLSNIDSSLLRATQALSFTSYLALVFTAMMIHAIAKKQYRASNASSLIVSLLTFFLGNFISKIGIDPFAILVISLLVLWMKTPPAFAPLVLLSMGINEKIPILFAIILIFRFAISIIQKREFRLYTQLLFACIAVAGYFTITSLLNLPGNEAQTDPALFLDNLRSSVLYTLSMKGLFLNALPVMVMILLAGFAIKSRPRSSFHLSDISGLMILLLLALIADVVFNVGRVVMYSYPLYLPAVACFIDDITKMDTTPL